MPFLFLLLLSLPAAAPAVPRPARIMSLNLCADQYLLALADRSQIVALTRFARDPDMSAGAKAARGLPVSRGEAEDVLARNPDLIFTAPGQPSLLHPAVAGRHYSVISLPPANSYADIVAQVRLVARTVGHPDRGERLIKQMNAGLAALPAPRRRGIAAYYQRRGYLTGTGTLVDELMRRAGLVNLAEQLHRPVLSQLPLEMLVAARPDYLVTEDGDARVTDQGIAMLHHSALSRIPRLTLPQASTVCGGPAYVEAARSLSAQIARMR